MPDITAADMLHAMQAKTKLAGELIQFQVQFATMMLNVQRTGMANDALAKILEYCKQLDEKGIELDA